jgi:hypothetical protein
MREGLWNFRRKMNIIDGEELKVTGFEELWMDAKILTMWTQSESIGGPTVSFTQHGQPRHLILLPSLEKEKDLNFLKVYSLIFAVFLCS